MTNSSIRMDSTQLNITVKKPNHKTGSVCRKHLKYPDQTDARKAEGGLRCENQYKQSLPNKPLISIITVVYNDQETLPATIESVLAQDYDNIEYIIVDGGSSDNTLEIIQSHVASIDYYISEPDDGIYSAMNKGLSLAQGDYVGLLNSGDWYENNALSVIAENGLKQPGAVIAATQKTLNEQYQTINIRGLRFMDERVYLRIPLSHPVAFIPYNIYNQIGKYAESTYDIIADWDFFVRCYEQKIVFHGIDDVIVNYWRVGISAQSNSHIFEEQIALLHSRFPSIRNYDLLFLLSSNMDEKSDEEIKRAIQSHLNHAFVIPKEIMKGVYLYRKQKDKLSYRKWLKSFEDKDELKCINDEYRLVSENTSIETFIERGNTQELHKQEIWLINERGWDAKDNGFVFYVWLKKHHPEINSYYVITKDSPDYAKVTEVDSNTVIEYKSEQHKLYYLFSKFVISSQGGDHAHPLNYEQLKTHYPSLFISQFVFLQHGVFKDNISYFHKGRFNSSLFVISGEMEKQLFEQEYHYAPDNLALTGLCRFDLLSYKKEDDHHTSEPYIFMMPTWRSWIRDERGFLASKYYNMLNSLLKSSRLNQILKENGFKLKLLIHPNLSQYSSFLKSGFQSIDILEGSEDIGKLIRECSFMISDYSSAIMDAAYMNKPIIYYQPDYDQFRASHYAETCFFSYKEHGLGAVVPTLDGLLDEITTVIDSGCKNDDKYRERAKYIFAHRDTAACRRIHDAMVKHETLPARLSQLYLSEKLTKMAPFQVLTKGSTLYVFLATNEKTGIIVRSFTIHYSLMNGDKKSQLVNLPAASIVLKVGKETVYAFTTTIPDLVSSIDILGNPYTLPTPILGSTRSQEISVAQIGFTIKGGAGIAALRLHKGLLASNIESFLFQKQINSGNPPYRVHTFENGSSNTITDWNNRENIYAGNTIFTLSSPSHHASHKFLTNFDIINFHWMAKYFSIETIAYLSHQKTPIVWTFHDINPLSGGCHYFHGCNNWQTDCNECPQLKDHFNNLPLHVLARKSQSFNFKNITVVVLNRHFKSLVKKSPLFNESRIEIIPNSIDTKKFHNKDSKLLYEKLGLSDGRKYILYVAAYASTIKGYKEFEETIRRYSDKYGTRNVSILLAGSLPKQRNISLPYIEFGHISEDRLIDLYNVSNVTVVSSIEDNHPNVMLESISCGTPVVGFKIGGLPDVIADGETGFTVELGDCEALSDSINKVILGENLSSNCIEYAEKNLKLAIQASRYKNLYKELLASPQKKGELANKMPEAFLETALTIDENKQVRRLLSHPVNVNATFAPISSQLGIKIPAKYNNSCFRQGWSLAESWGRWTDGEKAVIKLHINDYQQGKAEAIFAVKHHMAINDHFSILINGRRTNYEFKNGTLRFPVEIDNKSLEIVFTFKEKASPFRNENSDNKRRFGIGIEWFQIINQPLSAHSESLHLGTKVFAEFDTHYFKEGWTAGTSKGCRIIAEEARIKLHLADYQRGKNKAIFAVTHQDLINDDFTVSVNNVVTDYALNKGLLHFPILLKDDKNVNIVFKTKQTIRSSETDQNQGDVRSKLGIGVTWFQVINPYKKSYVKEMLP